MTTVSIEEAQAKLPEIIHRIRSGEEIVITEGDQPVARIIPTSPAERTKARQRGAIR